jgi:hypothetical protein
MAATGPSTMLERSAGGGSFALFAPFLKNATQWL